MNYKIYSNNENKPRAICLGYFDGIHLGHQELIKKTVKEAKENNLVPTFLTFDPDPNFVLGFKKKNELIMPLIDRFEIVKKLGIEDIIVLTFDNISMNLEPNEFIDYLLNTLNVKNITVGFDFSFGKRGRGKVKDLLELEPNIKVNVIEELKIDNKKVSSSYIIEDIKNGYVDSLDKTLGTLYYVKGKVIRGLGNGKKLSFPTLNFEFYDEYVLLKNSKSIRKICYSDIREVEKIMVINRMNIDKGYYRVKIKCKRKNYVVYSTSDEHRQQLDFEDTGISELYFELKRRGVKCC